MNEVDLYQSILNKIVGDPLEIRKTLTDKTKVVEPLPKNKMVEPSPKKKVSKKAKKKKRSRVRFNLKHYAKAIRFETKNYSVIQTEGTCDSCSKYTSPRFTFEQTSRGAVTICSYCKRYNWFDSFGESEANPKSSKTDLMHVASRYGNKQ